MPMGGGGSGGPHATSHENGGADEIDATGLDGVGGGASLEVAGAIVGNASNVVTVLNAAYTAIPYDTAIFNPGTVWAVSPNPSRITVDADGDYQCTARIPWDADTTGNRELAFFVNGAFYDSTTDFGPIAFLTQMFSEVISLVAGDYVEVKVKQTSGGSRTVFPGSYQNYLQVTKGDRPSEFFNDFQGTLRFREGSGLSVIAQELTPDDPLHEGYVYLSDGTVEMFGRDDDGYTDVYGTGADLYLEARSTDGTVDTWLDLNSNGNGDVNIGATEAIILGLGGATDNSRLFAGSGGKGVVFPTLAADPGSPMEAQCYWNTTSHKLRCWDGTAWQNAW